MITVYQITNDINHKLYIGQTSQDLNYYFYNQGWRASAGYTGKPYLYNAIRKHGIAHFKLVPIMTVNSRDEANLWETLFISACKSTDTRFGYNLASGGAGRPGLGSWCKGKKLSTELRTVFSKAQKKRYLTQSSPRKGAKLSEEQKTRISQVLKSKGISPSMDARKKGALASNQRTKEQRAEASRKAWAVRRAKYGSLGLKNTENGA